MVDDVPDKRLDGSISLQGAAASRAAVQALMIAMESDDEDVQITDIKGSAKALGSKLEIREIDPREIYFLQGTCSDTFRRCGRSLADTAQELTSRRVDPLLEDPFWSACPMLGSWRNG